MPKMELEEYLKLRRGELDSEQLADKRDEDFRREYMASLSTRDFLIERTQETIPVTIRGVNGSRDILIRARLSKTELKMHTRVMELMKRGVDQDYSGFDEKDAPEAIATFLAKITVDKELDYDFWMDDALDVSVAEELLYAYFTEPVRRLHNIASYAVTDFGQDFAAMLKDWGISDPKVFGEMSDESRAYLVTSWQEKNRRVNATRTETIRENR